jgi:predicted amidohydrolase YtcJ
MIAAERQFQANEVTRADLGVRDGLYFGGERLQQEVGAERARELPRIATALKLGLGLVVAGGTDAHRVSSYNPFVSLQW